MVVKKRKTFKNKKVTLNEFKAWLEGVEELQPDDWSPSYDQWELIRKKIGLIILNETIPKNVPLRGHERNIENSEMYPPRQDQPTGLIPPPPVGGVPNGEVNGITPKASNMLTSTGEKTITPDIDTTDGNYASTFT
jgi:hypothetical protein